MLKNSTFIILIFLSLVLGYCLDNWWKFIPSTLLICLLTILFFTKNWTSKLGISNPKRWIFPNLISCGVLFFISKALIVINLKKQGYTLISEHYLDYVIVPFQTLNEEFVFRSLLLTAMRQLGVKQTKMIVVPALIFTIFHWIFYAYNLSPENQGFLRFTSLLTLFFFGFTANTFFIATGNIGFPWALHCAWNLNRFGSKIRPLDSSTKPLLEYQTFNLLEGSYSVMALSAILATVSLFFLKPKLKKSTAL